MKMEWGVYQAYHAFQPYRHSFLKWGREISTLPPSIIHSFNIFYDLNERYLSLINYYTVTWLTIYLAVPYMFE